MTPSTTVAWLVDLVIAVTLLEAAVLLWRHRREGWAAVWRFVPNLAAGLCLLIALRLALAGAGVVPIALCLAGSGLAHVIDLRRR